MATLREMSKRLKNLDTTKIYIQVMNQESEQVLDMNRSQLLLGLTSRGKKIKPKYRNKRYAQKKRKLNSKPGIGTPDLKLSGDFHNSFTLKKKNNDYEFDATVSYKKYITPSRGDYGYDNVFGLNPKNQKKFNNEIFYPEYMERIKRHLKI